MPVSLIVDIVHSVLTSQGLQFATDPKPFIGRVTESVLEQVPPTTTINQVVSVVLRATCKAMGIEYAFDRKD